MNAAEKKRFRIKLLQNDITFEEFYFLKIKKLNITFANFRNMYYGSVKIREEVVNAIKSFLGGV